MTNSAIGNHISSNTGMVRLKMLLRGLEFEIKHPGMRLTAKAPKCSTIIRREFGLKGGPPRLLEQFRVIVQQADEAWMVQYEEGLEPGSLYLREGTEELRFKEQEGVPSRVVCQAKRDGDGFAWRLNKEAPWAFGENIGQIVEELGFET